MSDLVERLRSVSGCTQKTFLHRLDWEDGRKIITEAAARIEALEADIAASEHNFKTMRQLRNDAADHIEALEAALLHISELSKECSEDVSAIGAIQRIARAALAERDQTP